MTTEAAAKKDTQKLQRAIVDGLEDVKAQDIQVFDTEHLSPLFERVIVASGTSNRQTKALAASVRDAVREAGFGKPRIEGEVNGEWIIVDCGAAVAHIMQPAIRQYYHLEEIWGDKPVRTRLGAARPAAAKVQKAEQDDTASRTPGAKGTSLRRSSASKTAIRDAEQAAKKVAAARKPASRKSAGPKTPLQKVVVNKTPARKSARSKPAAAGAARTTPATAKKAARKASPAKP